MGSPSYKEPKKTPEELEMEELQLELMRGQREDMERQKIIQAEQEEELRRRDIETIKSLQAPLSRRRRLGAFGDNSLISQSYGGFARESRPKPQSLLPSQP